MDGLYDAVTRNPPTRDGLAEELAAKMRDRRTSDAPPAGAVPGACFQRASNILERLERITQILMAISDRVREDPRDAAAGANPAASDLDGILAHCQRLVSASEYEIERLAEKLGL